MKFFIDNNLFPFLASLLINSGLDAIHVKNYGMQKSSDKKILLRAFEEKRIIISADTDFGFILSQWEQKLPSLILFRNFSTKPDKQFKIIIKIAGNFKLELGKVVS